MSLSKEFVLELKEFEQFPGELALACMMYSGVSIEELDAFGRSLPVLMTDFANKIVKAPVMSEEEQVIGVALSAFEAEYPELGDYFGRVFCDDDDGDVPF